MIILVFCSTGARCSRHPDGLMSAIGRAYVRAVGRPAIDPDAFNAFEAAGWEERAPGYDRFFGSITSRLAAPLLDAARVGERTRVLDVATGPGYIAGEASARGASVVGVDVARLRRLAVESRDWSPSPAGCIPGSSSARPTPTRSPSRMAPSTRSSATS